MLWIILIPLAFAAAEYVKLFKDYGSNCFFCLALLFLVYGSFNGFIVWLFGWIFLGISMFKNVKLGIN